MTKIENISTEELEKELHRRKAQENRPKVKEDIDLEPLIELTEGFLSDVEKGTNREDDEHYLWEKTMRTIYGENFFIWFNKHNIG